MTTQHRMKKALFIFCLCFPFLAIAQSETLTNTDIIKLAKLDLPAAAIISKIKASNTHFDVGVDALVALKTNGVPGEVISEMISAQSHEAKVEASYRDYRDPRTMRKYGIYYYNKSDTNNLFVPIDPTVISNSKSGGFGAALARQYSYGLAKSTATSGLSGPHSRRQIPHTKPRFYFYLDPASNMSPNEFSLVRMKERTDSRQIIVSSGNAYGSDVGISEKQKVDFSYDQVADGIYKVYAKEPLEGGEYCFIYTGSAPQLFSKDKVYDFGIDIQVHD